MFEYCGCQQIAEELTREHDAVVAEIAKVRTRLSRGYLPAAAHRSRWITQMLAPHTAVGKAGLFSLMAADFPQHFQALEKLREHVLKEQDGFFPASLAIVDAAGWEAVEAVRAEDGSALAPARVGHHAHAVDHRRANAHVGQQAHEDRPHRVRHVRHEERM